MIRRVLLGVVLAFVTLGAQAAPTLLPNAQQQFTDANGAPLAAGQVYFYSPGTTTAKATYQDINLTVPNNNPVILDAGGRATVWGAGTYREIVFDVNGNEIWDGITASNEGTVPFGGFGAVTSVQSGSTVDLGLVTTHNVNISGSNSISSFGTSADTNAPIYMVTFSAAPTITYNSSTMILPGGTNIIGAAGDQAEFKYGGAGVWTLVWYQRAVQIGPQLHSFVVTTTGSWVVPSGAYLGTTWEIKSCGGGGGGTGAKSSGDEGGGGGGSGGCSDIVVTGLVPGSTATLTIGAAGTAGTSAPTAGGTGGTTKFTYNAVDVITDTGGQGGGVALDIAGGAVGTSTINVASSGLTLVSTVPIPFQPGGTGSNAGSSDYWGANGGASGLGTGGKGSIANGTAPTAGAFGAGGGAASDSTNAGVAGAAGGAGAVVISAVY